MFEMHLLAGDIGGTNTRLIYSQVTDEDNHVLAEKSYLSAGYKDFNAVLEKFISEMAISLPIDAACFAIAGPVKGGAVQVTNLPWVISERTLQDQLQTKKVRLINDFIAVAYGISELSEKDFIVLQKGKHLSTSLDEGDAVVIGAGTGLGASHLVNKNGLAQPLASEAGHVSFSPQNAQQCELLNWLWQNQAYVSLESLLSGQGLYTIYQFLNEVDDIPESEFVTNEFKDSDPAEVITKYAMAESDEICMKTLQMFIQIYGATASNIVLHYFPVNRLYIAGGIAPKIQNQMMNAEFLNAFLNKGLMTANLEQMTIKLVTQEKVGLLGALSQARMQVL